MKIFVSVGIAHARQAFRRAPEITKKKLGKVPKYGEHSPLTIALRAAANYQGWIVSDSLIIYYPSLSNARRVVYHRHPKEVQEFMRGERLIPFNFTIDTGNAF